MGDEKTWTLDAIAEAIDALPRACCVKPSRGVMDSVLLDTDHNGYAWFDDGHVAERVCVALEGAPRLLAIARAAEAYVAAAVRVDNLDASSMHMGRALGDAKAAFDALRAALGRPAPKGTPPAGSKERTP